MIGHRAMAGLAVAAMLGACGTQPEAAPDGGAANVATVAPGADAAPVPATTVASAVDGKAYVGIWTGPEGLSFVVEPGPGGRYHVRNRDTLDSEATFDATVTGDGLTFVRRGETLTARAGTGSETGFKWLANKKNCLIVRDGVEGYCRD